MAAAWATFSWFSALSRSVDCTLAFSRTIILSRRLISFSIFLTRVAVISIFGSSRAGAGGAGLAAGAAAAGALSSAARRPRPVARQSETKRRRERGDGTGNTLASVVWRASRCLGRTDVPAKEKAGHLAVSGLPCGVCVLTEL